MLAMYHPVVARKLLIEALADIQLRRELLILLASSSLSHSNLLSL